MNTRYQQKLTDFLKTAFPQGKYEWAVLLSFLVGYAILGGYIAYHFRIIFDDRIPWDAYFSFDNRSIVMTGGGFERHPLSNYFFDEIRAVALFFGGNVSTGNFRFALALMSNIAVSFGLLYIFKYLKNIVRLPLFQCLLLTFFTGIFSTCLLLSFTPETYTYSFAALCLFNYYAALKLRKNQEIPAAALTLATVGIGGLTITNAAKVYLPVVFEKNFFKSGKIFLRVALRSTFSLAVFIMLYLNRLGFDYHRIFSKTGEQYEKFSHPKATPLWDMAASWFFGGNMLFSGFVLRDYHSLSGFKYKALFMDVYSGALPYIFVFVIVALSVWGAAVNFKNNLARVILLSFLMDVVIHCGLKFGLHTGYIYGGHFVFFYPIMAGWLMKRYEDRPMGKKITAIIATAAFYLLCGNLFRMTEFFDFLNQYYR